MKITCSKSDLLNGINIVSKAVSSKSNMTTLQCILIESSMSEIHLIANDIELGIETIIKGTINESGKIALDAALLSGIVRKLPESDITIETNDKFQAVIKCENSKFTVPGTSGDDFNYLPEVEKNNPITISQLALRDIIRQTIISISSQESTKIMTGELFEVVGDELKFVALDGHRISIRKINLKEGSSNVKVIVPGKTLTEITKIMNGNAEDEVKIYVTDKHILFEYDDTKIVSRLLDGEFYNIDRMLSSNYETKVTVNRKDFLDAIDRASLLIRESDKNPIILNVENNNIYLKIDSSFGSCDENVEIKQEGKDIRIGFNPKFLMDALRVIDDENVDIYMENPKTPCFIKNEEGTYIYVILPISIVS